MTMTPARRAKRARTRAARSKADELWRTINALTEELEDFRNGTLDHAIGPSVERLQALMDDPALHPGAPGR